jgi:hypothetical protein
MKAPADSGPALSGTDFLFIDSGCHPAVFTHGGGNTGAFWVLFYTGTNPIHETSVLIA